MDLLGVVIATVVVVLSLTAFGMYCLNKSVDQSGR